jgi:S1-C subfamily serine protease
VKIFWLLLAIAVLLASPAAACNSDEQRKEEAPEQSPSAPVSELSRSVVQIVALVNTEPIWSGSGTVISDQGQILTNAHVVDDRAGDYQLLGVAVTSRPDEPPEPRWVAEILAVDYALDLAVIGIVSDLEGGPAVVDLPAIPLGDSDDVEIGEPLRILGFPGIGGETITYTEGVVSGFTAQKDIPDRAWIKTDTTIAGGNSGGLAANSRGELIGVPTILGSGAEQAPTVDCRNLADTNQDGRVDEDDECVVVGGFINGLRPSNLALPLVQAVDSDRAYVSPYTRQSLPPVGGDETPGPLPDLPSKEFDNLLFADGVEVDGTPGRRVSDLPSGAKELYAFWDYSGITGELTPDVTWDALWLIDGRLAPEASTVGETWIYGVSGQTWVAITNEEGLEEGLYELVLAVDGELLASASIQVGSASTTAARTASEMHHRTLVHDCWPAGCSHAEGFPARRIP